MLVALAPLGLLRALGARRTQGHPLAAFAVRIGETQWTRPVGLDVPAGERWTILARAPGHEDFEHEIVFGRGVVDMKLVIELRRRTP